MSVRPCLESELGVSFYGSLFTERGETGSCSQREVEKEDNEAFVWTNHLVFYGFEIYCCKLPLGSSFKGDV